MGFAYADLPRHGLGNLLFPWARACLYADDHGLSIIEPRWAQLRIGPYRRSDADKRQYGRLFKPQPPVMRAVRTVRLTRLHRLDESDSQPDSARTMRTFSGMDRYFTPLAGRRLEVVAHLQRRLRQPEWIDATSPGEPAVAMHVRLGDFGRSAAPGSHNTSTAIDWFVRGAQAVSEVAPNTPVIVCSDGSDSELAPLLAVDGVHRSPAQNPIQDIGVLMHSSLILGSGSTFSAWASYLGDTPMIVDSAKNHYLPNNPLVAETEADSVTAEVARHLTQHVEPPDRLEPPDITSTR